MKDHQLPAVNKHHLGIICLLTIAGIIIAGLWPFNFHPFNKVEWIRDGNGITFNGQAIVFSAGPLAIPDTASTNNSITIELFVQSHKESRTTVAFLLTLYGRDRDQFIIGQWKKELIIRTQTDKIDGQRHYHEIGVENALQKDVKHLITITSGNEATRIFVDGNLVKSFPHFSLIVEGHSPSGQLVLGNSPEGIHSWNGSFFGLAIYDPSLKGEEVLEHYHAWQMGTNDKDLLADKLTSLQAGKPASTKAGKLASRLTPSRTSSIAMYLFDEHSGELVRDHTGSGNDLLIPSIFKPLRRTILGIPDNYFLFSRANLNDIAINIVGFMPFGFFLSTWLRLAKNLPAPRAYVISLFYGFYLSLAIELAQVYIPARDSSLMDVISNTVGTAAGILIFKYTLPNFHKKGYSAPLS